MDYVSSPSRRRRRVSRCGLIMGINKEEEEEEESFNSIAKFYIILYSISYQYVKKRLCCVQDYSKRLQIPYNDY